MRDELVKEPEVTAVVDPTYKKAVDDFDKTKKILDKTMKGKENRDKPVLGKKEDKINLEESLFEDVEETTTINEAIVEIDDDDLVEMLMDRLDAYWNPSDAESKLYEKMYQSYVDNGVFEGQEINIAEIVDNDWVNYCDVVSEGDYRFADCKKTYADGDYEVYDENNRYIGYIEAVDDEENPTKFLIRVG